ncbi:hypothetical protein [Kutzneria buriramensis]|uniref:Ig-like domain-containing protein n=1 Tax=Kutzneria buriramensis TaxID=1045776 RepID=A0A3E0HBP6_9PSEU|nr:hypothetical protein [Kutzneria buriramensis]REH41811.1 hypothetical protein BCF44_111113 [Kutzneria buriramensis]
MASGLSRLLAGAAVTAVTAGFATVALAAPASAAITSVTSTSWAYTDSAAPTTKFLNPAGDAPVGAQAYASGETHITKAYFTFDLTKFVGTTVGLAQFVTDEKSAADCTKARTQQVWLTDTATAPTWAKPPAERAQLSGPVGYTWECPSERLVWDATTAVQNALAAGTKKITLELKLPEDQQSDPSQFRVFDHAPTLLATYNHAPNAPTALAVDGQACGKKPLLHGKTFNPVLAATVSDPDNGDSIATEFDWWPVDHPDQVTTANSPGLSSGETAKATILGSTLTDGATYAWRARSSDQQATGSWSAVCEVTFDLTGPNAPTVSSSDYPTGKAAGGSGIPGAFVFSPNGSTDVVGYKYGWDTPVDYVAATRKGGPATIVITPARTGPGRLTVESIDAAGNGSSWVTYSYFVQPNEPTVSCTPATAYVGTPRTCTITRYDATDVAFEYQINNGPTTELTPGADGTATVTVTPTDPDAVYQLNVRAKLSNGNLTDTNNYLVRFDPGAPTVDQSDYEVVIGSSVQFTLHSVLPGSTTFTYTWGGNAPVTVPVGSDGTATLSLKTDQTGSEELSVRSSTADGIQSATAQNWVTVDSNAPTVTSTDYPQGSWGGGVGVAGTFTFSSVVPNAISYTYKLDDGSPVTVPAGADGTATVSITPTTSLSQDLYVTANLADGSQTAQTDYYFLVNSTTP